MRPLALITLIVLTSASGGGAAPQARRVPDAGSVNGRVVAADTGLPLSGATVRLSGRQLTRAIPAGDEGDFEFGEVPPGNYLLTAVTAGYAMGAFGQRGPTDVPRSFELRARETQSQADVQLTRLGRISGQIVDESGRPAAGVAVQALRRPRSLTDAPSAAFGGGVTDPSGAFSVSGLPAGSYFVIATRRQTGGTRAGSARPPSLFELPSITYYPGTEVPVSAQTVRVDIGSESTNINFVMKASRLARVAGVVVDSNGRPVLDAVAVLNTASTDVPAPTAAGPFSEVDDRGRFSLTGVPPGVYSLDVRNKSVYEEIARRGGPGVGHVRTSPEFANVSLQITGDDVEDLIVRTDSGSTLSGRVVVEGPMPAPRLQDTQISATHVGNASPMSRWALSGASALQADGSFEIQKLLGLQIVRVSRLPAGWGLKRVKVGALDLTDEGIEVSFDTPGVEVVIARQSEITGVVTDRQGVPIPGATVVAFAEDQRRWLLPFTRYVRSALSTEDGAFTITGLAPGRYCAAVVPTLIEGRASDPDDLEPLLFGAARFSLGDGERRSLNLRLD